MSQPPAYNRQFDFTDFSAAYPTAQQEGVQIDGELDAVKATLDVVLSNLSLLQRDDGAPANEIVTLDTLAADVVTAIASAAGWAPRGDWVTVTAYAVGDVVVETTSTYVCQVAHTSGTFATDLAAGKWFLFFAATSTTVADGSITTAKLRMATAMIGSCSGVGCASLWMPS